MLPDCTALQQAEEEGRGCPPQIDLESKVATLEAELRRGKRREEKLQAMQFRLREDLKAAGGDPSVFDRLRDVRALEYELDFAANRHTRELQVPPALLDRVSLLLNLC